MKKFEEFLNEEHDEGKGVDPKKFLSEEQIEWCNKHMTFNWWVNESGEVEVEEDIFFQDKTTIKEFPIQFADVKGYFSCANCENLTSLKGAPRKVGKFFSCTNCYELTSLEGAPENVGIDSAPPYSDVFNCSHCKNLISLEGLPKKFIVLNASKCPKLPQIEEDFAKDEKVQEEWKKSPLDWKRFIYGAAAKGRKFGL